jgi:hypothetical protein
LCTGERGNRGRGGCECAEFQEITATETVREEIIGGHGGRRVERLSIYPSNPGFTGIIWFDFCTE